MQGFGKFIIGYVLGNAKMRKWCIKKVCQASCVIDDEFKKTPLAKVFITEKKDDRETCRSQDETLD